MKRLYIIISFLLIVFAACQTNEVYGPSDQVTQVELNINGLQDMGDSCWYEGWVIWGDNNENLQSIGVFQANGNGDLSPRAFDINMGTMQQVQKFLITIELDDVPGYQVTANVTADTVTYDSVAGPSEYHLMAGVFRGNTTVLNIGNLVTFENDYASATGTYMLDTPTDSNRTNPKSGIWFVNLKSSSIPIQGLQIPEVSGGWNYNGHINIGGTVVATGKFENPAAADDENPYRDVTGVAYPFPGEDFLLNAPDGLTFPVDLSGAEVTIYLNPPYPAGKNTPFQPIEILQATVPGNAVSHTIYQLSNAANNVPYGTAFMSIKLYE